MLVTGLTGPEFAPLHELVTLLEADGPLEEKWTAAVETLTAFTGRKPDHGQRTGTGKEETEQTEGDAAAASRKPFWKR